MNRLLLACLSLQPDDPMLGALGDLAEDDWTALVDLSNRHFVTPLLYHRLQARGLIDGVPPGPRQQMRDLYYLSMKRGVRLSARLAQVLRAGHDLGVPAIALKGAYLAERVYENPAVRPMTDVDLLVRREAVPPVERCLVDLGYTRENDEESAEICAHVVYVMPRDRWRVEVHWHIEGWNTLDHQPSPLAVDVDGLWRRAERTTLVGVECLALAPEDLLLHLCVHLSAHHGFCSNGIRSLCDIAEVARHFGADLNWDDVRDRARVWGAANCVYVCLRLARDYLAAPVPDAVLTGLPATPCPPEVLDWALARVSVAEDATLQPHAAPPAEQSAPLSNWGRLRAAHDPAERLGVVARALVPPRQEIAWLYNVPSGSRRVYLHYPLHWSRLVLNETGRLWRLLRREAATESWVAQEAQRAGEERTRRAQCATIDWLRLA
jgi:hypothetical protein